MADTRIKISISELEIMLSAFREKIIQDITQNIGSYNTIQKLRGGKAVEVWADEEKELIKDIETIGKRTEFPNDFRTLKRYLGDER